MHKNGALMKETSLFTHSRQETLVLAGRFAKALQGGEIIFLRGPIGAGKTVFVKGVAAALGLKSSPVSASFSLMKEYKNKNVKLFHIDLFRLSEGEVFNLGFEEMLEDEKSIILAEWPDPIANMLPADRLEMEFVLKQADEREIKLAAFGRVSQRLLEELCRASKM